jgi:hypothetical protein
MESNIQFTRIEHFVASFTPYSQLSRASDKEFPVILSRLQAEWNFVGALVRDIEIFPSLVADVSLSSDAWYRRVRHLPAISSTFLMDL